MQIKNLILLVNTILALASCEKSFTQDDYSKILWTADWSPDGNLIAVGGNAGALKILSGTDYSTIKHYPVPPTITKLKWHPNKELLAFSTQGSSQKTGILNLKTEEIITFDNIEHARGLGWNHNGNYLAVGEGEGGLFIFTKEGDFVKKIEVDPKSITGLHWHPSENRILTVGSQIGIYDMQSDSVRLIKPRPQEVLMLCVEWHPSGDFFVTGDYGDYDHGYPALLQFWDANGQKLKEIVESKAEYRNLRWSSDGLQLATASDGIRLWSKEGELLQKASTKHLLWGIDWHPNVQHLITTSIKGEIQIWDKDLKLISAK